MTAPPNVIYFFSKQYNFNTSSIVKAGFIVTFRIAKFDWKHSQKGTKINLLEGVKTS